MAKFGVESYDEYWRKRKLAGKTTFTLTHERIVELIKRHVAAGGKLLDCGVGPAQSYRLLAQDYQTSAITSSA